MHRTIIYNKSRGEPLRFNEIKSIGLKISTVETINHSDSSALRALICLKIKKNWGGVWNHLCSPSDLTIYCEML